MTDDTNRKLRQLAVISYATASASTHRERGLV